MIFEGALSSTVFQYYLGCTILSILIVSCGYCLSVEGMGIVLIALRVNKFLLTTCKSMFVQQFCRCCICNLILEVYTNLKIIEVLLRNYNVQSFVVLNVLSMTSSNVIFDAKINATFRLCLNVCDLFHLMSNHPQL